MLARIYALSGENDLAIEEGDMLTAERAYGEAEAILGKNLEAKYWHAVAMVNAGALDRALPVFAEIFRRGSNWRELTPRLVGPGFLEADEETLAKIMAAGVE